MPTIRNVKMKFERMDDSASHLVIRDKMGDILRVVCDSRNAYVSVNAGILK